MHLGVHLLVMKRGAFRRDGFAHSGSSGVHTSRLHQSKRRWGWVVFLGVGRVWKGNDGRPQVCSQSGPP